MKKTLLVLGLLACGSCFMCFLSRPREDPREWAWEVVPIDGGARVHPNEVRGLSDDDVWAVNWPNVFHYDGREWALVHTDGPEHVWPVARDDVWGVARGLSWFHFDGKEWTHGRVDLPGFKYRDFWGVVAWPGEVWGTIGIDGYVRFDGKEWSVVQPPELEGWELQRCFALTGQDGARHVYAAALKHEGTHVSAAVAHFDGARWELIDQPPGYQIRGTAPDDVWLVLDPPRHFDGERWAETPLPDMKASIYDLFARGPREAYAVGKGGAAFKWDGERWEELHAGPRDLFGIGGGATGPVWAVGNFPGYVLRYTPGGDGGPRP